METLECRTRLIDPSFKFGGLLKHGSIVFSSQEQLLTLSHITSLQSKLSQCPNSQCTQRLGRHPVLNSIFAKLFGNDVPTVRVQVNSGFGTYQPEHLICREICPQTVRLNEGRTADNIWTLKIK